MSELCSFSGAVIYVAWQQRIGQSCSAVVFSPALKCTIAIHLSM